MLVRDRNTGIPKGIAIIEFHSIEHATYALTSSTGLQFEGFTLKTNYAKETFVKAQIAVAQQLVRLRFLLLFCNNIFLVTSDKSIDVSNANHPSSSESMEHTCWLSNTYVYDDTTTGINYCSNVIKSET